MSSSNVQTTATTHSSNAASSMRPRSNRLISGLSDAVEPDLPPTPSLPSPYFGSRSASPIPAAHPQRSTSRNKDQEYAGSNSWGRRSQVAGLRNGPPQSAPSPTLAGLWGSSWSTLQGLASDLLNNEATEGLQNEAKKMPLPKWYRQMTAAPREGSAGWGPPTSAPVASDIGKGTKEAQQAALRAQKRKDMLLRQDSSYADTLGKFKRRLSDDMDTQSAPPGDADDRASLVYLHHVLKDDTMAGITIKYNCSANILRKANRMWTNDTPQSRQILVIPVGECGVKGRPLDAASHPDGLNTTAGEDVETPKAARSNGTSSHRYSTDSHSSAITADTDTPWHHDSWVQLPGFPAPTEIARLSRRTLGYFPPARRKSPSRSDQNTPNTSLDLVRGSDDMRQDSRSPQRPRRRLSNANNGYFPSYLAGPGGVGTMNKNVRCPGPAQDGLNKIFAKHFPNVGPPKNQTDLYQPEVPMYTDDGTPITSGVATPSGRAPAPNLNLENVGGAIETWARRMVTKAMTPNETQARNKAARASVGTPGKGAGGIGDLIEMTNEFEIGGDDSDDEYAVQEEPEVRRGRPSSASAATGPPAKLGSKQSTTGADYFGSAAIGRRESRKSSSHVGAAKGKKSD